jgi:hypothetical protein
MFTSEQENPHPVSTSPFWSIIKRAKNPKQTPSIPTLRKGHLEFKSERLRSGEGAKLNSTLSTRAEKKTSKPSIEIICCNIMYEIICHLKFEKHD